MRTSSVRGKPESNVIFLPDNLANTQNEWDQLLLKLTLSMALICSWWTLSFSFNCLSKSALTWSNSYRNWASSNSKFSLSPRKWDSLSMAVTRVDLAVDSFFFKSSWTKLTSESCCSKWSTSSHNCWHLSQNVSRGGKIGLIHLLKTTRISELVHPLNGFYDDLQKCLGLFLNPKIMSNWRWCELWLLKRRNKTPFRPQKESLRSLRRL